MSSPPLTRPTYCSTPRDRTHGPRVARSPMVATSSSPSAARRRIRPEIIPTSGAWSAAARPRSAACRRRTAPELGDSVVGLSIDQVNRRFAAACAAAGLEGRRTSHGGRVGLAAELTARGAATHAVQLAGGLDGRQHGGPLRRFGRHAREQSARPTWGLGSNGTESTVSDRRQRGF